MSNNLSELVEVVHGHGDFSSKLVSRVDRNAGEILTRIKGLTLTDQRSYSSVQLSEEHDIELNSDLVYSNHSCKPKVVFDMGKLEIRVVDGGTLKKGDEVTFFYPSTEWDMQQPFDCQCGSANCLGVVKGARYLDEAKLRSYWLNPHIKRLLVERERAGLSGSLMKNGMANRAVEPLKG